MGLLTDHGLVRLPHLLHQVLVLLLHGLEAFLLLPAGLVLLLLRLLLLLLLLLLPPLILGEDHARERGEKKGNGCECTHDELSLG